ncbi:hypothetical protein KQI52_05580 [bacterium]|nr:hypothetical protein [bacterium]
MSWMKTQRQLGIFRNMLIYAGMRELPNPLPFPFLDPIDEFWTTKLVERFTAMDAGILQERILAATQKIAEETAWMYNAELASLTLDVNEATTLDQLYGDWFVEMMHPRPIAV